MKFLTSVISRTKGYKALINGVVAKQLPIEVSGLSDVHKALFLAALAVDTGRKVLLLAPDEADTVRLSEDLSALGLRVLTMPSRDLFLGNIAAASKEYEHKRIDTLSQLLDGDFDLLCLSAEAATQYTMSPKTLKAGSITLSVGDTADIGELAATLFQQATAELILWRVWVSLPCVAEFSTFLPLTENIRTESSSGAMK